MNLIIDLEYSFRIAYGERAMVFVILAFTALLGHLRAPALPLRAKKKGSWVKTFN